jgi:hypothetical protein
MYVHKDTYKQTEGRRSENYYSYSGVPKTCKSVKVWRSMFLTTSILSHIYHVNGKAKSGSINVYPRMCMLSALFKVDFQQFF